MVFSLCILTPMTKWNTSEMALQSGYAPPPYLAPFPFPFSTVGWLVGRSGTVRPIPSGWGSRSSFFSEVSRLSQLKAGTIYAEQSVALRQTRHSIHVKDQCPHMPSPLHNQGPGLRN